MSETPEPPKTRCPVCGQDFYEPEAEQVCTRCGTVCGREELIGELEQCAWDI